MIFKRNKTTPHAPDPFAMMQMAVEVVNSSPHPVNKIAAALAGIDHNGDPYAMAATNSWPEPIRTSLPPDTRIGNSSATIHAETSCILRAPRTEDASIYITDPFCPNCAKNIAEAGIKKIHIDHKGFEKDFAERRGNDFQAMSMEICRKAGISVYEVRRKDRVLIPILEIPDGFTAPDDNPVRVTKYRRVPNADFFTNAIDEERRFYPAGKFAVAVASDPAGKGVYVLSARDHLTIGMSAGPAETTGDGKYTFVLEPVNRLLMNAARLGVKIMPGYLFSATVPTAREQVNMIGADQTRLLVGNLDLARDQNALDALKTLTENDILTAVLWP